jgi:hypothetical protein
MQYCGPNWKETKTCFHCTHSEYDPGCPSSYYDPGYPPFAECILEDKELDNMIDKWSEDHPNSEYENVAEECPYFDPILLKECAHCHKLLGVPQWSHKFWASTPFNVLPVCSEICKYELEDKAQAEFESMIGGQVDDE